MPLFPSSDLPVPILPAPDLPAPDVTAPDVLVAGGGVAALCAALSARQAGATVLLLEAALPPLRGGNARHSRNMRIRHEAPTPFTPGRYDADDWRADLLRATDGRTDEALAGLLMRESSSIVDWLAAHGVLFQSPDGGLLPYSRKTAFFHGGGKALVNALYATAAKAGIAIRYGSEVTGLEIASGRPLATVREGGTERRLAARAVVVASGGYQADPDWLRRQWGEAADALVVRGTPHATGRPLRALLDLGAAPAGDPGWSHMVAVDARSPASDGGIVTRLDGMAQGIVVDGSGRRFADEGAETGPARFAAWGERLLHRQPAYLLFDSRIEQRFAPPLYPPVRAHGIADLATQLDLEPAVLEETVRTFNAAIRPGAAPLDSRTVGLAPDKSRLALPLAVPPFGAIPMRPGITSTNQGVRVDRRTRVLTAGGDALPGLYAAGVVMAPNILGRGYLAGCAMTIGAVFGRIAGREAAAHALA